LDKGVWDGEPPPPADLARALYAALAAGDREQLDALLHPEFTGRTAEGMPFGIGGDHDTPAAMRRNGLGKIARHFEARAEPERFPDLADGRLLATGRYRGRGKQGGAPLDAAFAHLIAIDQGHIKSLEQFTDTARWRDAAGPLRTVLLDFEGHVATLRLNRPDKGNAIDTDMAADLAEAATQIAERSDIRAVLIAGNGPNFTVGGDLDLFAGTAREQLPNRLRRMIDNYHLAIERLTSIDAADRCGRARRRRRRRIGPALRRRHCRRGRRCTVCTGLWRAWTDGRRWQHLVSAAHGGDATCARAIPAQPPPDRAGGARVRTGVASGAKRCRGNRGSHPRRHARRGSDARLWRRTWACECIDKSVPFRT
jgi:ketosteroid isomerase-like protein